MITGAEPDRAEVHVLEAVIEKKGKQDLFFHDQI